MMKKHKRLIAALLLLAAVIAFVAVMTPILTPKRHSYGCLWKEYLQEPKNTVDVLCLGSSEVYCDIVPSVIYENSGITSYIMAGPVQTLSETYYYLREACKTQSPKVVLLELSGMFFERTENYDLINIGYMPFGTNKWKAMAETVPTNEWLRYIFPMFAYHSRWSELTAQDVSEAFSKGEPDLLAGNTYLWEVIPLSEQGEPQPLCSDAQYAVNENYLQKIADYCTENGIRLVCWLAPRYEAVSVQEMEYLDGTVKRLGITYEDFSVQTDAFGINKDNDFYDRTHFNCRGAMKFSAYLADYLTQTLALSPTEGEDEALWQQRIDHYFSLCYPQ